MSRHIPPSPRIEAPSLTGRESWLDPEGTCKTTCAEIEARWGVPQRAQIDILLMRQLSYEEYLKTSHWQEIRRQVWIRQDGKCGACSTGTIRDVHHREGGYARKGFERDGDVIGLCRPCHEVEHNSMVLQLREAIRNQQP